MLNEQELILVGTVFISVVMVMAFILMGVAVLKRKPLIPCQPTCKRKHTRHHNSSSVRAFLMLPGGDMEDCYVQDWSEGGLGLFLNCSCSTWLRKDMVLLIKSSRNYMLGEWTPIFVQHFNREAFGWTMGCVFKEKVSPEVLEQYKYKDN